MFIITRYKQAIVLFSTFFLFACSHTAQINDDINHVSLPLNWHKTSSALTVKSNWLSAFNNKQITRLVNQALTQNHQLIRQAYSVAIAEKELLIAGSELLPELDLALSNSRSKDGESNSYSSSNSIDLTLSYEVDLWGKLSAYKRNANFTYLAQKASFEDAKQQLVADVVTAYYAIVEAQYLLRLYEERVENSQQNLSIIETSYQSGLNQALDVYLGRNELNSELTQVIEQKNAITILTRVLERLLGEYPAGNLAIEAELPLLTDNIPLGLPSELVSRKPALKASWYEVLAQDAALAYAHKQRFPSFSLSGSIGPSVDEIANLLSLSSMAWSLASNLSAPLFNAGRLAASEQQARLLLQQSEQQYLDTLFNALSNVENALSTEKQLKTTYKTVLMAQDNAQIATTLSFEQYQNGLVDYTTVLDAQSRYFDAQSSLLHIKTQLLTNRITLHLSLGGDFNSPLPKAETK